MSALIQAIEELSSKINQLERRMNNMIREGEIADVDYEKGLASMKAGDVEMPMSSWLTRAGAVRDWNPVTKGERAIWFSPTGEPGQGLILPGGFSKNFPQNHNGGAEPRRTIGDYTFTEASGGPTWVAGGITMKLSSAGLQIEGGGASFTLGPDGYAQNGGSKTHDGMNVGSSHVHGGVVRGGTDTFGPH